MSNFIFFWGGPFSQWFASSFIDNNGVMYNCAEQYMMAKKAEIFGDMETYEKIMKETDPKIQKKLGREVKNFDADAWAKVAKDVVFEGNYLKFTQNKNLLSLLTSTELDHEFVEASPYDKIWGIGLSESDPRAQNKNQWLGLNLLGKILTDLRNELVKTI